MTPKVNETARHLAGVLRRYVTEAASRYRTPGKHAGPEAGSRFVLSPQMQDRLRRARAYSTPARKTAALGTGASLLLSGMVFGVAEAATLDAPETVSERQLVNTRPLADEQQAGTSCQKHAEMTPAPPEQLQTHVGPASQKKQRGFP